MDWVSFSVILACIVGALIIIVESWQGGSRWIVIFAAIIGLTTGAVVVAQSTPQPYTLPACEADEWSLSVKVGRAGGRSCHAAVDGPMQLVTADQHLTVTLVVSPDERTVTVVIVESESTSGLDSGAMTPGLGGEAP